MKIKLDENLPTRLKIALEAMGHDTHTVEEEGLQGTNDELLWDRVQREARFLITQDLDFSDIRRFAPGTHAGVLLIRVPKPGRAFLYAFIVELFRRHDVTQWERLFIVATQHKVRVVRI